MSNTFAIEGVRLSYFRDFIASCGGCETLRDLNTTDVCNRFVKPMTAATKCSVCELLRHENNAVLADSNVFISHAWKYKFLDVVEAVRFSLTKGDPTRENDFVVWFDLFTNCQHGLDEPPPFSWWCNTFKVAISDIGHTLMVLSPWADPITLTRAWCLFELYATADCQCRFSIAMSEEESQSFISDMKENGVSCLNAMLASVNVEKSEAWNPLDRDQIFEVVRQSVGFSEINRAVLRLLRQWALQVMEMQYSHVYVALADTNPQKLAFTSLLGDLYVSLGLYSSAEKHYTDVFTILKDIPVTADAEIVAASNNLANVFMLEDHLTKAEMLYHQCLTQCKSNLSASHPLSLQSMRNWGYALIRQRRLEEAEVLHKESWEAHKSVYGENHKLTLGVVNNWMGLYSDGISVGASHSSCPRTRDKCDGGYYLDTFKNSGMVELFRRSFEELCDQLGKGHPHAIDARGNMSIVLRSDQPAAITVLEETVDLLRIKRGQDHPVTLSMMHNLALLYSTTDCHSPRAKDLYDNWLRGRKLEMHKHNPHRSILDCKNALFSEVHYWPDTFEARTNPEKRLMKEFETIMNNCLTEEYALDRYFAGPHRGDLQNWVGYVIGPSGSVYEGEPYRLNIRFPLDYPFKPVRIRFVDTIFHPCISPTDPEHFEKIKARFRYAGKGLIDCLDLGDGFSPAHTVLKLLGIIEEMLANPLAALKRTGHGGIYFEDTKWNFFVW